MTADEAQELIETLTTYSNGTLKVYQQDVALVTRVTDGNVIQLPLTQLHQIEDLADLPLEGGGLAFDEDMHLYANLKDGGGLAVDDDGAIYVSTEDVVQDGGGLAVDDDGDLYVDFSTMPTDKFEAMLKTLTVPIFLTETLYQYVDCENGDDTIEDGRGGEDMPWKTISACVDYVTTYYNVNSQHITIRVLAGTYEETVNLGSFSVTTGYISIVSYSGEHEAIIAATNNDCCKVTAGVWHLEGLSFKHNRNIDGTTTAGIRHGCLGISGASSLVQCYGCKFYVSYDDDSVDQANSQISMIEVGDKGQLKLMPSDFESIMEFHNNNLLTLNVFHIRTGGQLSLLYSGYTSDGAVSASYVTHTCSGECTHFALVERASNITYESGGNQAIFVVADGEAVTGMRYKITGGSSINVNGAGGEYFPGDEEGTVGTSTYCWYA